MDLQYSSRLKQFDILVAQDRAIKKAADIGINLHANVNDTNLWPDNNLEYIAKLNRFGDRYLDIFGDNSQEYIFTLEANFSKDNWFKIEYFCIEDRLLTDDYHDVSFGFKEALGRVFYEAERSTYNFSNIEINEDEAKLYIDDEIFAIITKLEFSDKTESQKKEVRSTFKGLHSGCEFCKQEQQKKISKIPGLKGCVGYRPYQDGLFLDKSISNFVKGFKWLLESLSEDKISLSNAEKVMWSFYDVENEHQLRANEKNGALIKPYFVEVSNGESERSEFIYFKDFPEAIWEFGEQVKAKNLEDLEYVFDNNPFGYSLNILDPESECNSLLSLSNLYINDIESNEEYIELADKFFSGNMEFSSRKDSLVKHIKFKEVEVKIHQKGKYHYIENDYGKLVQMNRLEINLPKPKLSFGPKSREPEITQSTKWKIIRGKESILRLGELSNEEIEQLSKDINLPINIEEISDRELQQKISLADHYFDRDNNQENSEHRRNNVSKITY